MTNKSHMYSIVLTNLVGMFIKDTNYKLKEVKRDMRVCDILKIDKITGKVINYGSINKIINSKEFREWMEKNETE